MAQYGKKLFGNGKTLDNPRSKNLTDKWGDVCMTMETEREQSEAFKEDSYFRKHSLGWLSRRSRVDHHFIEWWSPRGIHQSHCTP